MEAFIAAMQEYCAQHGTSAPDKTLRVEILGIEAPPVMEVSTTS